MTKSERADFLRQRMDILDPGWRRRYVRRPPPVKPRKIGRPYSVKFTLGGARENAYLPKWAKRKKPPQPVLKKKRARKGKLPLTKITDRYYEVLSVKPPAMPGRKARHEKA